MLTKIQWPRLKAVAIIGLFSVLYGIINITFAGYIRNPLYGFQLFAYLCVLTAIIEWYFTKYYTDSATAKRFVIANIIIIILFILTLYFSITAPQLFGNSASVRMNHAPRNPFVGFAFFVGLVKYASILFPIEYKKK